MLSVKRITLAMILILVMVSSAFGAVVLLNGIGSYPSQWSGLSTDIKPLTGSYGSTFYTEDTGILYMYGSSGWVLDNRNLGG